MSGTSGFGYASFLLGVGSGGRNTNGIRPALSSKSFGFYVQDDWKVSRKLTLNLGLRWDFETGLTERYDRFSVFDPEVRSPLSDQVGMDRHFLRSYSLLLIQTCHKRGAHAMGGMAAQIPLSPKK